MPIAQRDYVLRLIEQIAALLRRLVEKLVHGRAAAPEVVREAQQAQGELLGPLADILPRLDAGSAVQALGEPRQVALWIELLRLEATAVRLLGEGERALALEGRAGELARALGGLPLPPAVPYPENGEA